MQQRGQFMLCALPRRRSLSRRCGLEVIHQWEHSRRGLASLHGRPADERVCIAEHDDGLTLTLHGCGFLVGPTDPASGRARVHGRRRCSDTRRSAASEASGLVLAGGVSGQVAGHAGPVERRCGVPGIGKLDCPEGAPDPRQVFRLLDLFVPQELGPGADRCVSEVVSRPFSVGVPACGRLRDRAPEKWPSRVAMSKADHVAPAAVRLRANSRIRLAALLSEDQAPSNSFEGVLPLSLARGRWNHLRIPMSL